MPTPCTVRIVHEFLAPNAKFGTPDLRTQLMRRRVQRRKKRERSGETRASAGLPQTRLAMHGTARRATKEHNTILISYYDAFSPSNEPRLSCGPLVREPFSASFSPERVVEPGNICPSASTALLDGDASNSSSLHVANAMYCSDRRRGSCAERKVRHSRPAYPPHAPARKAPEEARALG